MSGREPRFRSFSERQRYYRERFLDAYFPGHDGDGGKPQTSPFVRIILIMAVFICLIVCGMMLLVPVRWLWVWLQSG